LLKKPISNILDRDFIEKIYELEPEEIENELIKHIQELNNDNSNKKMQKFTI